MNVTLFLFGYRILMAEEKDRTALLDLCLRESISYSDFQCDCEGRISFRVSFAEAKRLLQLCEACGIEVRTKASGGIPHLLWRYRRRMGLFLGILLTAILLRVSGDYVWDVRVTGNETMTESEVLSELRACGFGIGSYIPSVHAGELENRVLLASERIAWISVYLDGTVARVQVIEHASAPLEEDLSRPANLVAACDGQIEMVEIYRGNCVVSVGQAVRQGELLVSGLYDSNVTGYRYTRAAGKILARTERSFRVEIPLSYTERSYEEPKCNEILLKFFNYSLKIFKSYGNGTDSCDIIKEDIVFAPFGSGTLPLGLTVTKTLAYTETVGQHTPEEALNLAYAELERSLGTLSDEAQLLSKRISTTVTDNAVILDCTVCCVENIAVQTEFEITE